MAKRRIFSRTAKVAYDPRIWSLQLDNKEKRKWPLRSDRHKAIRRSGAFCRTAGTTYDPEDLAIAAGQ
ncbi:hypothetical protein G159_09865 [Planococcus glaciei CHR43]|uniref:hypothetical protein n=1 Tax=Planococcus glaciei TaxID=459472 RepID=UPI0003DEF5F0|nr:hypothetical protein [Planococcus glaciei]ETP68856.1 hypothetical protein G159_09865 [Planococcus glaciei CHR43]